MTQAAVHRSLWQSWRSLVQSLGQQGRLFQRCCLCLLLSALLQGVALACLYPIFDAVLHFHHDQAIYWLCWMTGVGVASIGLRWYAQGFEYNGQQVDATHNLRLKLGEHLRHMPLQHLQRSRAGELNAKVLGSVDEYMNYTMTIVNALSLALVTPLAIGGVTLLAVDWRLGLLILVVFPVLFPLYRWRRPTMNQHMAQLAELHQQMNAEVVEYLQGAAVVRASGRSTQKTQALYQRFAALEACQTGSLQQGAKANILIASVVELGLLVVILMGFGWVVFGSLNLAWLAAVMVMVVRFSEPLATSISYAAVIELIEQALLQIESLMTVKPLAEPEVSQIPSATDIRFDAVSFQYDDHAQMAIHDMSFHLPEKGMTAFVGPSGSGKTTLTRLLMRYADPQQGAIRIGGVDLRDMRWQEINRLVSVVYQDVYLFNDTVLANLLIANPNASMSEVEQAARAAQCLSFIQKLPQGWLTPIGDMGERLSGGEKQRLSIARALLKNAPIVILDEPTAALDILSEREVQHAIDHLVQQKTVLIIAHRLTTVVGADRILVIDEGGLIAQGHHQQLMDHSDKYRAMWQAQQLVKTWDHQVSCI